VPASTARIRRQRGQGRPIIEVPNVDGSMRLHSLLKASAVNFEKLGFVWEGRCGGASLLYYSQHPPRILLVLCLSTRRDWRSNGRSNWNGQI